MMIKAHGFNNKSTEVANKRLYGTRKEIPCRFEGWGKTEYLCFYPFLSIEDKYTSKHDGWFLFLTWQLQLYSKYKNNNSKINDKDIFVPFCFRNSFCVTTSASLKPFPSENYLKLRSGCLCRLSSCWQDRQSNLASSFLLQYYLIWKSETGKALLLTCLTYF